MHFTKDTTNYRYDTAQMLPKIEREPRPRLPPHTPELPSPKRERTVASAAQQTKRANHTLRAQRCARKSAQPTHDRVEQIELDSLGPQTSRRLPEKTRQQEHRAHIPVLEVRSRKGPATRYASVLLGRFESHRRSALTSSQRDERVLN